MGVSKKLEKKEKSKTSLCNRFLSLQAVFCLIVSLVVLYPVNPNRFTVNNLGYAGDANLGDGVCETVPGNGICTGRAATQETEALFLAHTLKLPNNAHNVLQVRHLSRRFKTTKDPIITNAVAIPAFSTMYKTLLEASAQSKAISCVSLQLERGPPSI